MGFMLDQTMNTWTLRPLMLHLSKNQSKWMRSLPQVLIQMFRRTSNCQLKIRRIRELNAETEVQLMVSVPIHQDTSLVPPMITLKSLELDYSNQGLADQEEARKKKRKKCTAPRTPSGSPPSPPPPPPPPAGASGAPSISRTSGSSQLPPPPPPPSSTGASGSAQQVDSLMQDDSIPDEQVHLSDDEDSENDHLPKDDSRQDWWKPLPEEKRPATPEPS
ncbi:hypothetical protein Tco_0832951 [Tanacetum coccineum]